MFGSVALPVPLGIFEDDVSIGAEAVRTVGHIIAASLPPHAVACVTAATSSSSRCPTAPKLKPGRPPRSFVARPTPRPRSWPGFLSQGALSISVGQACRSLDRDGHESAIRDYES